MGTEERNAKMRAYGRRLYRLRRKHHVCCACKVPLNGDKARCPECRRIDAIKQRERRAERGARTQS